MKNLEMNQLELTELSSAELQEVDGGLWWVAVSAVLYVIDNWADIEAGFND